MKTAFINFFLRYIRFWGQRQLAKVHPQIVGITGSAGKTSTRDAVATVLRTKYTVKVSDKANSHTGIPLDILGLHLEDYSYWDWLRMLVLAPIKYLTNWQKYQVYVVEMGVDSPFSPKNMSYLLTILRPNTGVFINALPVHSEPYDSLITATEPKERSSQAADLIAAEKGKIITTLPAEGTAVLNIDDPRVANLTNKTSAKVLTVGKSKEATIRIRDVQIDITGFKVTLVYENENHIIRIANQVLGPQYATTLALAVAVGLAHGIDVETACTSLQEYRLPPGRMSLLPGIDDSLILDSSYNASTQPMLDALEILERLHKQTKRPAIAVLGDMRELGAEAAHEHTLVAQKAVDVAEHLILVGPLMKQYAWPIALQKMGSDFVHWFPNSAQAALFLREKLPAKSIVLVKASQNTLFLERVVETLLADPSTADQVLCRRGEYWDKIRAQYS